MTIKGLGSLDLGPIITTEHQILDSIIEGRKMKVFSEYRLFDDFFWAVPTDSPFEINGSSLLTVGQGGIVRNSTTASAGNRIFIATQTTIKSINSTNDLILKIKGATDQVVKAFHYVGLADALMSAAVPPVEALEFIYFRAKNDTGAVNWFAVTHSGFDETAIDTGILCDTNIHDFEIRKINGIVTFLIDGVEVAKISTSVPSVAVHAGWFLVTQEAVIKRFRLDTFDLWGKR